MLPGVLTDRSASSADDRLRRFEAVTNAGLAHLDVDELLKELLGTSCRSELVISSRVAVPRRRRQARA